jgi:hypothetical protein
VIVLRVAALARLDGVNRDHIFMPLRVLLVIHDRCSTREALSQWGSRLVPQRVLDHAHTPVLLTLIWSRRAGIWLTFLTRTDRDEEHDGHSASPGSRTDPPFAIVAADIQKPTPPQSAHLDSTLVTLSVTA